MGRRHRIRPYTLVDGQTITGNLTITQTSCEQLDTLVYQLVADAALRCSFKFEASVDGVNWSELNPSTVIQFDGSDLNHVVEICTTAYNYVRPVLTHTVNGVLDVIVTGSSVGA